MVPFRMLVYLPDEERYEEIDKVPEDARTASISGTQVRDDYLAAGRPLPDWFTRPEVAEILAETYPPRHRQGVCIWFTGLTGAGKSTTAYILTALLQEYGRQVTLLDGDVVRTHFSEGLGFSKEDRDRNVRRMGYVAAEIVRHGGVVVCAAVSPYRGTRNEVRNMVGAEQLRRGLRRHTAGSLRECATSKGLYASARRGEMQDFTGVDDPLRGAAAPRRTRRHRQHAGGGQRAPHRRFAPRARFHPQRGQWLRQRRPERAQLGPHRRGRGVRACPSRPTRSRRKEVACFDVYCAAGSRRPNCSSSASTARRRNCSLTSGAQELPNYRPSAG